MLTETRKVLTKDKNRGDTIDKVLTNKWLGIPIFKKVGLSGKSVIPFVITIGCAVPGIMASRTIRNERERRATAMLAPFMPCGAKIPVIALFAGAFFDDAGKENVVENAAVAVTIIRKQCEVSENFLSRRYALRPLQKKSERVLAFANKKGG